MHVPVGMMNEDKWSLSRRCVQRQPRTAGIHVCLMTSQFAIVCWVVVAHFRKCLYVLEYVRTARRRSTFGCNSCGRMRIVPGNRRNSLRALGIFFAEEVPSHHALGRAATHFGGVMSTRTSAPLHLPGMWFSSRILVCAIALVVTVAPLAWADYGIGDNLSLIHI